MEAEQKGRGRGQVGPRQVTGKGLNGDQSGKMDSGEG